MHEAVILKRILDKSMKMWSGQIEHKSVKRLLPNAVQNLGFPRCQGISKASD